MIPVALADDLIQVGQRNLRSANSEAAQKALHLEVAKAEVRAQVLVQEKHRECHLAPTLVPWANPVHDYQLAQ